MFSVPSTSHEYVFKDCRSEKGSRRQLYRIPNATGDQCNHFDVERAAPLTPIFLFLRNVATQAIICCYFIEWKGQKPNQLNLVSYYTKLVNLTHKIIYVTSCLQCLAFTIYNCKELCFYGITSLKFFQCHHIHCWLSLQQLLYMWYWVTRPNIEDTKYAKVNRKARPRTVVFSC